VKGILVGLGKQCRGWYKECRDHPEVELVAFAEISEEARKGFQDEFGPEACRVFPSLDEAIRSSDAEFVLDVTPPAAHRKVAETALAASLHVLGEKPLADNMDDARAMVACGRKAGRKHMITQNFRFGAKPRTTRRLIGEDAIGEPGQLDIAFYVPWACRPGTHYVTEPFMFLTDMGVHHFDMMRYVVGADPVSVQTISWNQPWGWHKGDACHAAVFAFPDGLMATHVAIGCSIGHQTPAEGNWRIEGPEGSITWEDNRIFVSKEHPADVKRREEIALDALPAEGKTAILNEFVAAVREDREPECHAADNLKSLQMTLGAVESARTRMETDLTVPLQ
jgi:predicted dehydrogenase